MNASTLVLLHGWGLTPGVWGDLVGRVPAGLCVATPPLPGHGDAPSAAPSLAAWGDALLPAIPHGAILCGWSLGGLIALDLARRHPERIARLVLIGTSACFVRPDAGDAATGQHGLEAATVDAFISGFAEDPQATLRRFIALQAVGDARRRGVGVALASALAPLAHGKAGPLADGLGLLAGTDLRASLRDIEQPTLLVHGAGDALMPIAGARSLAGALPDARLAVLDDCGHAPFLSRPAECAELIGAFALE